MKIIQMSKIAFMILPFATLSLCSSIFYQDTFKVDDQWVYNESTSSGCCSMKPSMQYRVFEGLRTIRIINKGIDANRGLFYICSCKDSGITFRIIKKGYTYIDSLRDSVFTDSNYIDTVWSNPLQYYPYAAIAILKTIVYKGDTLLLEADDNYAYLQHIGFLRGRVDGRTNQNVWNSKFDLISFNNKSIDTTEFNSPVSISALQAKHSKISSIAARLEPSHLILLNVNAKDPIAFTITDIKGRQIESGIFTGRKSVYFKKELQSGCYALRVYNSAIAYSYSFMLVK
jgi:hypothetical protein